MSKIRVLIVDDSVVIRKILSEVLSGDSHIEIAGVAANGKIALAKIPQVNPDLITLDIEMPEMDGLETLRELRKDYPDLPVVMFSTLTERGAEATLDALSLGASDYVTKPANVGKVSEAIEKLRTDLIPKIKALVPSHGALKLPSAGLYPRTEATRIRPAARPEGPHRIDIVAIGISTGGPNALVKLLPALSADFPVPIVIVQHMPPVFTKNLARRLDQMSPIQIEEGEDGAKLEPGTARIAPGGIHMVVQKDGVGVMIATNEGPPENSCRPAADVLFRSVADVYGPHVLAVVMTGMGYDGHLGSEYIHEAGGIVIAQDEASSVVWGMPGIVVTSGLAQKVLPLSELAAEISRLVDRNRREEMSISGKEAAREG